MVLPLPEVVLSSTGLKYLEEGGQEGAAQLLLWAVCVGANYYISWSGYSFQGVLVLQVKLIILTDVLI